MYIISSFNWGFQNYVTLLLLLSDMIKSLRNYTQEFSFEKGQQAFKIRSVNLKSRSTRTSLKRTPASIEHNNYQRPQDLYL